MLVVGVGSLTLLFEYNDIYVRQVNHIINIYTIILKDMKNESKYTIKLINNFI